MISSTIDVGVGTLGATLSGFEGVCAQAPVIASAMANIVSTPFACRSIMPPS